MIRLAIVEDDARQRDEIVSLLKMYESEQQQDFSVTAYTNGVDLVEGYSNQYDILLLDIQMRTLNGIETAARIRARDSAVQILFITSYPQYALEGYEVDARAYIVKPISYLTFKKQLDRALRWIERNSNQYLVLNNSREMQRFNLKSIQYIESAGHYAKIHTDTDVVFALSSLKEIEQKLKGSHFFRCSMSVIVNFDWIESISNYRVRVAGKELTISRAKKRELMEALTRHVGGLEG